MFPFLAVLICTLGTLILMLALIANDGNKAKAASAESDRSTKQAEEMAELAEVDAEIDRRVREAVWHREQVVRMRDQQTADLEERRIRQAHLEDHLKRLRDEMARLEAEVAAAHEGSQSKEDAKQAVAELRAKIDQEKAKIKELEEQQQSLAPRIVIVPHKGPNGTDRRPVYIECKADGVYLHPEGVAIDPRYLDNGIPGPNPLDAALRAIRHHAMQNYGDTVAPYPLIVVRPDGIDTYSAARSAMREWDDQFGYELVPNDVKLAFPDPDPILKERIEQVVAQAVREQKAIASNMIAVRGLSTGRGGGAGTSSLSGKTGRNAANGGTSNAGTSGTGTSGTGTSNAGTLPTPTQRSAADLPILSARNMEARTLDALENGYRPSSTSGAYANSLAQQRAATEAARAITRGDGELAQGDGMPGDLTQPLSGMQGTDAGANTNPLNPAGTGSGSPSAPSYTQLSAQPASGMTASGTPTSGSKDSGMAESGQPESSVGSGVAKPNDAPESRSAGPLASAADAKTDAYAPLSSIASKSSRPSASTDPNAPIGGSQSSGSSDSSNPAGTAPQPLDPSIADAPPGATPPLGATMQVPPPTPPKPLVTRKGSNWALPRETANMVGTAMVRTIRVECHEDRLVLLPEGGRGATHVYGFSDGNLDRASLELATAIRDRVSRWGAGMPGGRWVPRMEVDVAPGGELRYQQLQRLMSGSGVEVLTKEVKP
jgi:hypothetical protein